MTDCDVDIDLRVPLPGGGDAPAVGSIRFQPTRARDLEGSIILPREFEVTLVDGQASVTLAPTVPGVWAWRIIERVDGGRWWYAAVPDGPGPVDYDDLEEIDRDTLNPAPPTSQTASKAYVDALIADLQAELDAIEASDVESVAGLIGAITAAELKTALSLPSNTVAELAAEALARADADTAIELDLAVLAADLAAEAVAREAAIEAATATMTTALAGKASIADLAAEAALARDADNLTSGTVADARIPATIARDSEVTAAVADKVAGPASADDGNLVRFDGTTGKLVKSSSVDLSDGGTLTGVLALHMTGAFRQGPASYSADTTLTTNNPPLSEVNAASAPVTMTLPSTANPGYIFTIKKLDSSGNAVTVAATSIDGAASIVLASQYDWVTVASTSTPGTWRVIGRSVTTKSQVGLGNVDNTSDANKPVSTAQQSALDGKQPLDSDLTTIAGLTPVGNDLLQFKSGNWINRTMAQLWNDLKDLTVTLTNKTIALGSNTISGTLAQFNTAVTDADLASLAGPETLTNKRITKRVFSTASAATLTIDSDSYDAAKVTAQAAGLTIAAPTGTPTAMQGLIIRIKDNGTARALTWNAVFRAIGVTLPTTTVISKTLYAGCIWNEADSKWDVIALAQEA